MSLLLCRLEKPPACRLYSSLSSLAQRRAGDWPPLPLPTARPLQSSMSSTEPPSTCTLHSSPSVKHCLGRSTALSSPFAPSRQEAPAIAIHAQAPNLSQSLHLRPIPRVHT